MNAMFRTLLFALFTAPVIGQVPFKSIQDQPDAPIPVFSPAVSIPQSMTRGVADVQFRTISLEGAAPATDHIRYQRVTPNGSIWMDLKPNQLWSARTSVKEVMQTLFPGTAGRTNLEVDWQLVREDHDPLGMTHIRLQQTLGGLPVHGQDVILHARHGEIESLNGYIWTGRMPATMPEVRPDADALAAARTHLSGENVAFADLADNPLLQQEDDQAQLLWLPLEGGLQPAYRVQVHPNAMDHWTVFLHAGSLEVLQAYSELCSFAPRNIVERINISDDAGHRHADDDHMSAPPLDGATTTTDQDLFGVGRTINAWQVGSSFFMIDASRTSMFNPGQSDMPNDPVGVIWTIDAFNTSPETEQFEVGHCTNTSNNWKALEVSAHYNGGRAFEYFRQTFNRNSINGNGGNVISIINVAEANGSGMDNAFWSGTAMFYGNGNVAFQPLAKGLDVAGHEMSHGVIGSTANLEYVGQSGALNESYADIFGAMIDRDDWKMGEDVVNTSFFPSGALRDLQNPNNGGNSMNDNGWQPKHMNEYVNLPNTPQGDNGGVHVNSGIPNRAFFLVANAIGKEKAEQIYYRALVNYLVKSSQFVDMRIAAERAAADLHGGNSAEVNAVRAAYDGVGIGAGTGGDYEVDIQPSPGQDFFLVTDEQQSDLYWVPPANPSQLVKLNVPAPLTRPSFTDNGNACVYVDQGDDLILLQFDWTFGLEYGWNYLETNPNGGWRNIVVSKDGTKLAFTTAQLRDEIIVYDFGSQAEETFGLYNPTTAPGGLNAGDVLYADAMEWAYDGEYIIYDALNRIDGTFGSGIEYWNISYIDVWDNGDDDFAGGQIGNVFSGLPENVSVGNPSLAKNSPYIMVFDYLETYEDFFGQEVTDYLILAANLETGDVAEVFENTTVGYPCYSKSDDKVLFTYDDNGSLLVATIDMEADKLTSVAGTEVAIVTGAQKGVWFVTGEREFTSTDDVLGTSLLEVRPQPATDAVFVQWPEAIGGDYTVIDNMGRAVLSGRFDADGRVAVGNLPAGLYTMRLEDGQGSVRLARFIKG
jgi:Zn-dependent metalloprotease